ncbi:hypothetical protein B0H16DRAFT_1701948 [Mycena metata]|uniref:Uncharacterized protein n=1 Tax=Mycena metata TaxID=1033252 RepID=A0AAD7MG12_9AGAR|nr:hypothetical protein B0H16DRAFT_1701948 [Mycena metata]
MAALAGLLMHLPDAVLEQFRDASFTANFRMNNTQLFSGTSWVDFDDLLAWLRRRGDMDHLVSASDSNFPFDPRSMYGTDVFNSYADNFDEIRSATPSSSYSYPYDDSQSSNYSVHGSEFDYLSASGYSTPYSGLNLFGENVSEGNSEWDSSLAAFFYSAEPSTFGFGANLPPTIFPSPPRNLLIQILHLHTDPASTNYCSNHYDGQLTFWRDAAAFLSPPEENFDFDDGNPTLMTQEEMDVAGEAYPTKFLSPPQENFNFEDGNPTLMTQEEMDVAGEAWQWERSDTVWLDKDVSSDVYVPTQPFSITKNNKVSRIERVHGIPSQFPVPRLPTAYLVNFSSSWDTYQDDDGETLKFDKILKEKDCHSWDGTPGERASSRAPMVHGQLFASIGHFSSVQCRRSRQNCQGIHYCKSIDTSLINVERYELDPRARDAVNNAQIVQRLDQGSYIQDKVICVSYVNTVKGIKCTAKNASGGACGGYQSLNQIQELPSGRKYYFACSNRSSSWKHHSGIQIPPDVDEDLCIRSFRGESITDGAPDSTDSTDESCSRVIGSGSGKKGKSQCPFPHTKDGKSYVAPMCKLSCQAKITFLVPLDEENIPLVVVLPKPLCPHTHPPPPDTKVPTHVKLLYEKAIRAFGTSIATVNKVDQVEAASTMQIMGAAPGLVHPSLLQAPTKQGIISALKRREPGGDKSGWEGLFDLYRADQEKDPRERYMHSFDFLPGRSPPSAVITTFENFLLGIYRSNFKAWDPDGWLVTVSGDMEAAPWIGMARSFIKRMDTDKRPTVDEFLPKVLRVCRRHALEGVRKNVKPHVDEDQWTRFQGVFSLKTRDDVREFGNWVFSLNIKPVTAWWNHKVNHKWILPGLIECLSGLSHEEWMTTPFTSNGNETQHHWTNTQTGIGLPARECILRARKADHAVGLQFEASLASGIMASNRNELSHRTARNAKRHTSTVEKAKLASAGNNKIKELRAELAILVAALKTNSSGVVRVTQKSKAKSIAPAATRTTAPKKTKAPAEGELDGIQMASPEDEITSLANTADDDDMVISLDDADLGVPSVNPSEESLNLLSPSAPSPAPSHCDPPAQLPTRRSTRKRGASQTHDDAPAPKSKKTEAAITPEAVNSAKKRGKRKPKPWSVQHTDDKIYTSFEFLAQFPEEYRVLYGDTLPA